MRKILVLTVAAVLLVSLIGCGGDSGEAAVGGYAPDQEAVAYAYVHGGYVGRAVVTTDAEGAISAQINEAFLPHTLAEVDLEADEWSEANTVFYVSHGSETRVAKYISYAGTNYVGTTFGTAAVYVEAGENGEPVGAQDLEQQIIRNQSTMAAYYDGIADGAFAVFTEFGGDAMVVTTTSYGSFYKEGSSYWAPGTRGLGWQANVDAVEEFVAENGAGATMDDIGQDSDGVWEVMDATTGATASDFRDYFNLIQSAAGRLTLN